MSEIKKTDLAILYPIIEESINNGGSVKIKVSGFSMYPLISSRRDSVVLKKAENLKKGDVPFYKRSDGTFILHRIVGVKNGAYVLRGDYEQKKEYPIYPEQVVAVAEGFYRNDRYISCDSFSYKLYKLFWMNTAWCRPQLLKIISYLTSKKHKRMLKVK